MLKSIKGAISRFRTWYGLETTMLIGNLLNIVNQSHMTTLKFYQLVSVPRGLLSTVDLPLEGVCNDTKFCSALRCIATFHNWELFIYSKQPILSTSVSLLTVFNWNLRAKEEEAPCVDGETDKKMLGHNRHFAISNCSCYLLIMIVNGKSLPIYLKILNLIKIITISQNLTSIPLHFKLLLLKPTVRNTSKILTQRVHMRTHTKHTHNKSLIKSYFTYLYYV